LLPCGIDTFHTPAPRLFSDREKKKRTKDETSKTMNLIRNYRNWRRYRETVSELNRLSNRELSDLGFSRSDIPYVARKAI
jgi:uncharacterized protein YjiS (DUF1127 family)